MKKINPEYIPIIGLEVHIELNTKRKMFCRCCAEHFLQAANSNTCPTCLGLPGAMPYPNKTAIENTVLFGLALGCKINKYSKFDRKHYFYPDLPKGYQITQYDLPFCLNGKWESPDGKFYQIRRVHLEEDTGKLQHKNIGDKKMSLIDFNRSGVPLMELVTEPSFHNPDDVLAFLKDIQTLARYLQISNADMEKGSMRLEANISLTKITKQLGIDEKNIKLPDYKVELKNINSFRFLKNAIHAEIVRQTNLLSRGEKIKQETRGYDEQTNSTYSQRSKENVKDYRYFPEPDIPSIVIEDETVAIIQKRLVESPWEKRKRYIKEFGLSQNYAQILTSDLNRGAYFEKLYRLTKKHHLNTKKVVDLMINKNYDQKFPTPQGLVLDLLKTIKTQSPSDEQLDRAVSEVLISQRKAVSDYKSGKENALGFLIGAVSRKLSGKGDAMTIRDKLTESLGK
ncbi:MAG: aspartyl/glutamyl-tRNA amidotransferase subunit B [Candidatus Woesebacteria bacterium GW2011_GWA1_39_21]|uniref:Aspartyl/glutamyl-tRNA(Asn/Gln) amidotransferase subunit B n=1 Tax=Candidatus Woesebacteria bacterium GW2011_GWA1_39_21 TaxID=1618550 RepID=A0A0G0RCV6_9BACT|nr:MAG: aspartyl/glutamyl-tRNA amidotransferase subunit B [Candidatus Woesebacteria bacterium GW2011_GWA1_39_21]